MNAQAQQVLDFWFGKPGSPEHGIKRSEWFVKSDDFDEQIRQQFGALTEQALAGELDSWVGEGARPLEQLACIVCLDQFTRNIFRNTPKSFAGDQRALAAARDLVNRKLDQAMLPVERLFAYLPFEHSEDIAVQVESLALFKPLDAFEETEGIYDYAVRHHEFIERFGRFPHRNEILRRQSTPEEIEFLKQPGSRF